MRRQLKKIRKQPASQAFWRTTAGLASFEIPPKTRQQTLFKTISGVKGLEGFGVFLSGRELVKKPVLQSARSELANRKCRLTPHIPTVTQPSRTAAHERCGSCEDAVKSAGEKHLPRLDSQTDEEFLAYRKRGAFINATARSAEGFISLIFRRLPFIKVPESRSGDAHEHTELRLVRLPWLAVVDCNVLTLDRCPF